jgi:hemoglobin
LQHLVAAAKCNLSSESCEFVAREQLRGGFVLDVQPLRHVFEQSNRSIMPTFFARQRRDRVGGPAEIRQIRVKRASTVVTAWSAVPISGASWRIPVAADRKSRNFLVARQNAIHLADALHRRVMADDVVSHAFHPRHVERLAAYRAEALGGPSTYSDCYGDEASVVRMRSGNGEYDKMNCRAIACFDQALVDIGIADDSALRQVLHDYFAWATTTTMSRYHQSADYVPSGLSIPHWSWDGL